jgi:D-xylose transport system ATP-binding protein
MAAEAILTLEGITKRFGGVVALDHVDFDLLEGEIHGLCGENGAGKSTLMKILSGVHPHGSFDGVIRLEGKRCTFRHIREAESAGIGIIHQELMLVEDLSVGENIFLGSEPLSSHLGFMGKISWHDLFQKAGSLIEEYGFPLNYADRVGELGIGQRQMVEIAKALSKQGAILILDEPTSALSRQEAELLFKVLRLLKQRGTSSIYISHKLEEVLDLADRITILRDGLVVETRLGAELTTDRIASSMVGRNFEERFPPRRTRASYGRNVLEVEDLTCLRRDAPSRKACDGISFALEPGEILGVAGLMGSGRTALALALFGAYGSPWTGSIRINGKRLSAHSPRDAIKAGISLVPEDRKEQGLMSEQPVLHNLSAASLERVSRMGLLDGFEERDRAGRNLANLKIKGPGLDAPARNLSGGNQQKVVIAKYLNTRPSVLILDEPTRGIDVGAKQEVYGLIRRLAEEGVAILMISSELPEILGLSDRILVLHEGKPAGIVAAEEADEERIMKLATGVLAGEERNG